MKAAQRVTFTLEELTLYLAHKLQQDGKIGNWTHAQLIVCLHTWRLQANTFILEAETRSETE